MHFELGANDPERAIKFYTKTFGWNISKWGGPQDYWLIETGSDKELGINGAIFKKPGPVGNLVNTIDVPNIDEYVKSVEKNGGKILVPKTVVPGVGYLVYFQDTEGNAFGMMQRDEHAAISGVKPFKKSTARKRKKTSKKSKNK